MSKLIVEKIEGELCCRSTIALKATSAQPEYESKQKFAP